MDLERQERDGATVLIPRKNLTGGDETRELEQAIRGIADQGTPRIVVDLGNISYLSSAALGILVSAHMTCQRLEGWLRVARISKRIRDLLIISRLAMVFETLAWKKPLTAKILIAASSMRWCFSACLARMIHGPLNL